MLKCMSVLAYSCAGGEALFCACEQGRPENVPKFMCAVFPLYTIGDVRLLQ